MDLVAWDDSDISRGIQFLDSKRCRKSSSRERKEIQRPDSPDAASRSGLDLGRRLLVVVQPGEQRPESARGPAAPSSPPGAAKAAAQKIRIVDHGGTQKEAVRRLFEAQVMIKSYEEQITTHNDEIVTLNKQMKLATSELRQKSGQLSTTAASDTDGAENISKRPEKILKEDEDGNIRRQIPQWLKNDQDTRCIVEEAAKLVMHNYLEDNRLDASKLREAIWGVALDCSHRWGGDPNDELVRQCETLENRVRKVQREALQESSMARQHVKMLEKKYKELHAAAKTLRGGGGGGMVSQNFAPMAPAPAPAGGGAAPTAAATGGGNAGGGGGGPLTVNGMQGAEGWVPMCAGCAINCAMMWGCPPPAPSVYSQDPFGTGGGGGSVPTSPEMRGAGGATAASPSAPAQSGMTQAQAKRFVAESSGDVSTLTVQNVKMSDDESVRYSIDEEELEVMDSELFEPIKQFDSDMQELLIDIVNEKVRRILTLDASKFPTGTMPFGLRPDNVDPDALSREGKLESEIHKLKDQLSTVTKEKELLEQQVQQLRLAQQNARMQKPQGAVSGGGGRGSSDAAQNDAADVSPAPLNRRRGNFESGEKVEIVDDGSAEKVQSLLKELQGLKNSTAREIKQLKGRVSQLEKQLEEAGMTPAPEQPPEAQEEAPVATAAAKKKKAEAPLPAEEKGPRGPRIGPDGVCGLCGYDPRKALASKPRPKKEKEEEEPVKEKPAPVEKEAPPVKVEKQVEEEVVVAPEVAAPEPTPTAPARDFSKPAVELQQLLHRVMVGVGKDLRLKATDGQASTEKVVGPNGDLTKDRPALLFKSLDAYGLWAEEFLLAVRKASEKAPAVAEAPAAAPKKRAGPKGEPVKTREPYDGGGGTGGSDDGELAAAVEEVKELKDKCRLQQDEISKLILTIDELRKRITSIGSAVGEAGSADVIAAVGNIMNRAGLKDMMEAPGGPKLKGVFERLYQDAVQRIQRLGLIRERAFVANQAYNAVIQSVATAQDGREAVASDLSGLSATTAAALRGMWYHTDFLFRHACEYAMGQGIEATILKGFHPSLLDLMEPNDPPEASAEDTPPKRGQQGDRLPARRSNRPQKSYPGAEGAKAFWNPLPGGIAKPSSPRSSRKALVQDPGSTPFTAYVAAMKESRGELRHDEWPNCQRQEKRVPRSGDKLDALLSLPGRKATMASSQSLPVLPKGRSVVQATDGKDPGGGGYSPTAAAA